MRRPSCAAGLRRADGPLTSMALCADAPRTASMEGGEDVIVQSLGVAQESRIHSASVESEEDICDNILHRRRPSKKDAQETSESGVLAWIRRVLSFG